MSVEFLTIIIVDDSMLLRRNLKSILEKKGHKIIEAANGLDALKFLNNNNIDPDFIIIDLIMPEMDGWELINKIKLSRKYKDIPIAIITANITLEIETEALRKNINHILPKPFKEESLNSIISDGTHYKNTKKEKQRELELFEKNKDYTILVCDNSKFSVHMTEKILKIYGYSTIGITDPKFVLGEFETGILYNSKVDLIITDIAMPELDGYELCKKIKAIDKFKKIPIIALSALLPKSENEIKESGFGEYILKPINTNPETHARLIASIKGYLI